MRKLKSSKLLAFTLVLVLATSICTYATPVHKEISEEVSGENIYAHIEVMASKDDARLTGTEGEEAAADYIAEQLESYGLDVRRQEFDIVSWSETNASLEMINPEVKVFQVGNLQYSCATPNTGIIADVVNCGLGYPEDFPTDTAGKIALILRGEFTFAEKVQNAADAGAVAAIIYNHSPGPVNGTLSDPSEIPAMEMLQEDGLYIIALLEAGNTVSLNMVSECSIDYGTSQNVVGTLKADSGNNSSGTIVMGAHMDCVDTPGANDNASGVATILEAARILSDEKLAYDIEFAAFGAEEIGLVGSYQYLYNLSDEEFDDIVAMINLDMVGIGEAVGVMTVEEDAESFVADLAEVYLENFGYPYDRSTSSSSDHEGFELSGIPSVFLDYHEDPYYHTDEDSLDKIDQNNLYKMGCLVTSMTYDMAKTPMPKSFNGLKAKVNKYKSINRELIIE
ncbi:MAG: M20/M25/M40 family metallo-hydrolase [Clostridiaceae bacterium]|nr:M20/M25/M40 family metallo-hydrolase [Clostridiaceae bacterium]